MSADILFNKLDNLLTEVYDNVYPADLDWADDFIEKMSDALYEGDAYRMQLIMGEWSASYHLSPVLYRKLEELIANFDYATTGRY